MSDKRLVKFVAMQPSDTLGITADMVRDNAHSFMSRMRRLNTDKAFVVESFITTQDAIINNSNVYMDSWIVTLSILDDKLYNGLRAGKYNAVSLLPIKKPIEEPCPCQVSVPSLIPISRGPRTFTCSSCGLVWNWRPSDRLWAFRLPL